MKKEILHLFEKAKLKYIENEISESMNTIIQIRQEIQNELFENRKRIEKKIQQKEEYQ